MSMLRGSENYIWNVTEILGQGATGNVYKCRNKKTGELFAVKTFNSVSYGRPMDVQMREFEVLKKLCHENIVQLHAIEEEMYVHSKVLVMDLCTGGSLFNILDDPENAYGIEESEFVSVLHDVGLFIS
jgi:TANK-binding kinase 1